MTQRKLIGTNAINQIAEHLHAIEDIINEAAPDNSYLSISFISNRWLINNDYWIDNDPCEVKIDLVVYGKSYTGLKVEDIDAHALGDVL